MSASQIAALTTAVQTALTEANSVVTTLESIETQVAALQTAPPPPPPPNETLAITSVSPLSGPVGTSVTIVGTGFGATQGTSTAAMGIGFLMGVTSWSDTQIVGTVPTIFGVGQEESLVVTLPSGASIAYSGFFTVTSGTAPPPPTYTITPATPTGAVAGTAFTFTGVLGGYTAAPTDLTYSINAGAPVAMTGVTATGWSMSITPTAAGSDTITVTDAAHSVSGSASFVVSVAGSTHTITPTAPTGAVAGTPFTFTGTLGGYGTTAPTDLTYSVNGGTAVAMTGVTATGWSESLTLTATGSTTIVVTDAANSVSGSVTFTESASGGSPPPAGNPPAPVATSTPGSPVVVPAQSANVTFTTVAGMTLQMTSPVLTNESTVVFNSNNLDSQIPPYQFYGDALSDSQMPLPLSASVPFAATVGTLVKNVAVYMHGAPVFTAVPVAGKVSGTINMMTSNHGGPELNGPVVMDVDAWDSAPGVASPDGYENKQRVILFITGSTDYVLPTPPGAAGLTLAFEDEWTTGGTLSVSSTNTSAKWYPKQTQMVGGDDFGDAVFQDPANLNGGPNPFTQMGNYLRIRAQYSPGVTDPAGYGRVWTTGMLSTAFPGGTAGFFAPLPYYAECRFLSPIGGTPWPAFWQLLKNALINNSNGNIETDTVEIIGLFPLNWRSGGLLYPAGGGETNLGAASTNTGNQPGAFPTDFGFWEFHTFGISVTTTTTTFYMDNVETGSFPTPPVPPTLESATGAREDFFMIDNALGGGGYDAWNSPLPNSAWYDMWVGHMRVYT